MTASDWAAPGSRLFLVAYEGADGRPYAFALSELDAAHALARERDGEVIDTIVDGHADMSSTGRQAIDPESGGAGNRTYTVEVTWRVPEYAHLTVEAGSPQEASEKALAQVAERPDGFVATLDYETCGPDLVTGIWQGDEAYPQARHRVSPSARSPPVLP